MLLFNSTHRPLAAIRSFYKIGEASIRLCRAAHRSLIRPSVGALALDVPFVRNYARTRPHRPNGYFDRHTQQPAGDILLQQLESVAQAPGLKSTPSGHVKRLSRAFSLSHQINAYMHHWEAPFDISQTARQNFQREIPVAGEAPNSEIARGRHAVSNLLRVMLNDILSIPAGAKLRKKDPAIFDVAAQLEPLVSEYLKGREQEDPPAPSDIVDEERRWGEFWKKAQGQVTKLGDAIARSSYGSRGEIGADMKEEKEHEDKFWEIVMGMVDEERKGGGRGRRKR